MKKLFASLLETAAHKGASRAAVISSREIIIKDHLAGLCNGDMRCEHYGLSPSCPPHVPGPETFRQWRKESEHSIVIRLDIPSAVMFSDERREVMQLLHEIAAAVQYESVRIGYKGSKAFAGGSCKAVFCHDHHGCNVLSDQGECRHPRHARPSMSGFGIDVIRLIETAGGPSDSSVPSSARADETDKESMTWVAALVLIDDGPV